jgi:hypothetical protein
VTAVFETAMTTCLAVLPTLCDTISDQRFNESGMLVHDFLPIRSHKNTCHKNPCQDSPSQDRSARCGHIRQGLHENNSWSGAPAADPSVIVTSGLQ